MIFHIYPVGLLHCTVHGEGPWSHRTGKNHDTQEPHVKVSVKENEVPTEKMLVARIFSLQRQVVYQIKAKRSNYLITDFISSKFKRRLSFLVLNSEVSSLLLKLQPFRVVKYSFHFYCI